MIRNVGESDQVIRLILGTTLLTLAATEQIDSWAWVAGFLSLASGSIGFCGVYGLLRLNTSKSNDNSQLN
jgi:hypothetical protein